MIEKVMPSLSPKEHCQFCSFVLLATHGFDIVKIQMLNFITIMCMLSFCATWYNTCLSCVQYLSRYINELFRCCLLLSVTIFTLWPICTLLQQGLNYKKDSSTLTLIKALIGLKYIFDLAFSQSVRYQCKVHKEQTKSSLRWDTVHLYVFSRAEWQNFNVFQGLLNLPQSYLPASAFLLHF